MSKAKVRARRRQRANRAWTKAMQPEVYSVAPQKPTTALVGDPLHAASISDGRIPSHFWAQLDAAIATQPALDRLLRERFPYALFLHDEVILEVAAADVGAAKEHGAQLLQEWYKANPDGRAFAETLRTTSERPNVMDLEEARKNGRALAAWGRTSGMQPMAQIFPREHIELAKRMQQVDEQERRAESCKDDLAP